LTRYWQCRTNYYIFWQYRSVKRW